jgi:chromosome partitioning protein
MRIFAIANQKGGVGKTTTALALGHALADLGKRVLMIDLDPQSSLTLSLHFDLKTLVKERTLYNLLMAIKHDEPVDAGSYVKETAIRGLHIIPATPLLAKAEGELGGELSRETFLKAALVHFEPLYDYVLIDCPPSIGILTANALTAATDVIIPVQADYLALLGAELLMSTAENVRRKVNPQLEVRQVLITMYDQRTKHAHEVLEAIQSKFGDLVFSTPIKQSVRVKEAPVSGQSIIGYEPDSDVAQAYRLLATELNAL